jgi:DNA-binding HxlR family transcriptional regulator
MPQRKIAPRRIELDDVCVIREGDEEYCIYPLGDLMSVLGKKWTLFVIAVLGNRDRVRFTEILADLRYFISSRSLADRLKDLEAAGLVARQAFSEAPPRVDYRLTPEGRSVRGLLLPLLRWSLDWERRRTGLPRMTSERLEPQPLGDAMVSSSANRQG